MRVSLPKSMTAAITPGVGVTLPPGLAPADDLAPVLEAAAAYGAPVSEHRFHPVRRWRFDLAWPTLMVALEREGSSWTAGRHTRGKGYASDCEKYNAAAILKWVVIRATADMIRSGLAQRQLLEALAAAQPK